MSPPATATRPGREDLGEIVSIVPNGQWDQGNEQIFAYGMRPASGACSTALEAASIAAITFYMCGRADRARCRRSRAPSSRPATSRPAMAGCGGRMPTTTANATAERADLRALRRRHARARPASGRTGFFCRGSESPETRIDPARARLRLCQQRLRRRPALLGPVRRAAPAARPALCARQQRHEVLPSQRLRARRRAGRLCARRARQCCSRKARPAIRKLLNIGWHLRIAGRPGRFAAFKRVLALARQLRRQSVDRAARRHRAIVAGAVSRMSDLPTVGMPLAFGPCGRRYSCRKH